MDGSKVSVGLSGAELSLEGSLEVSGAASMSGALVVSGSEFWEASVTV
jgi:hypothetical protein